MKEKLNLSLDSDLKKRIKRYALETEQSVSCFISVASELYMKVLQEERDKESIDLKEKKAKHIFNK